MSKYENVKAQLEQLLERQRRLEDELAAAENRAAEALLKGEKPPRVDLGISQELSVVTRAVAMAEQQLQDLERAEWRRQLADIEERRRKLAADLEKAREAFKPIEEQFRKAEHHYGAVHFRITQELDALERQEMGIRAKLEAPGDDEAPCDVDPARVQAILADLRAGKITSFMAGQDPAQDEACRLYQGEIAEILRWHRRDELSRRTTGERVAPPECARCYSKDQLQAIIKKSEAKGGAVEPKDNSGLLLEGKKVSI